MAKTEITRACGHTETINIVGPIRDRDRKEAWEAGRLCRDCYRAKQQSDRDDANATAAAANAADNLPALTGTPKQIAWAESIRRAAMVGTDPTGRMGYRHLRAQLAAHAAADSNCAIGVAVIDEVLAHTEAAWWIDQRESTAVRYPYTHLNRETKARIAS